MRHAIALAAALAPLSLGCEASFPLTDPAAPVAAAAAPSSGPLAVKAPPADAAFLATVDSGVLQGEAEGETLAFRGVPFAAPPIGPLRFHAPAAVTPWSGVREAKTFGSVCPQRHRDGGLPQSEDCLTLNVWRPAASDGPLPVLVFIHGGSNVSGSSAARRDGHPLYDGARMAQIGHAVVVTLNYRLGVLGFLAHKGFADSHGASGNWAHFDQIAALEWVKKNIHAFGGDPARVVVFGQSSGAKNVCTLVASPLAKGLFSGAIIQSGRCVGPDAALTREAAEASGAGAAAELGCGGKSPEETAVCLRALPPEKIVDGIKDNMVKGITRWEPNIDGELLNDTQQNVIAAGAHNHVPLIIGSTSEEMASLFHAQHLPVPTDEATYLADLKTYFGDASAPRIAARYPLKKDETPQKTLEGVLTDATGTCTTRWLAKLAAAHQTEPVRRYLFAHAFSGRAHAQGAAHTHDLYFLFRSTMFQFEFWQPDAKEAALSDAMIGYWARFAATGDPNGGGAPAWPAFGPGVEPTLVLDDVITVDPHARTDRCDFWEGLGVPAKSPKGAPPHGH
jgi:para-nitrobenzyl esterase